MTASRPPEPTPTHHHGDGRRCSWAPLAGWWFVDDYGAILRCFRQDHPSGNAEVAR